MIAFIIRLHTLSYTHATCSSMYGTWRCSCKLPLPTCLVDRRKETNNMLILRASERINEKYQTSSLWGRSTAHNQVLKKEKKRKIMGLRGSSSALGLHGGLIRNAGSQTPPLSPPHLPSLNLHFDKLSRWFAYT